jgi:hypothetical protein
MTTTDTTAVRVNGLDKFYTIPSVARHCIETVGARIDWTQYLVIEPSAGNGSFLLQIPTTNRIGLDIAPEHPEIIACDFFTYEPPPAPPRILVLGNPPFGRNSSTAVQFFNHAAKWSSIIAFIVPRTFRRVSVQNRLDPSFHLVHDHEIATTPCSFTPPMMAKCCFQIWERRDTLRVPITLETTHPDWEFLSYPLDETGRPIPPTGADFAIRAYGGACGEIVTEHLETLRPKSWHWIRARAENLMERFASLDYSISRDTARQNSIGRGELVSLYRAACFNP